MRHDASQRVEGERVFLRPFTLDDAEKVFRMSLEAGMKQWIPDQVYENLAHAREVLTFLIEQYKSPAGPDSKPLVFGICVKSTGELIGHVGLSPVDKAVEIGYAIEERMQGKGCASEAVCLMLRWAFETYNVPAILGIVAKDNAASVKLLERVGFRLRREERRRMHGRLTEVRTYEARLPTLVGRAEE